MRRKTKKLLDMALRELHTAIEEGKEKVEMVLEKSFYGDVKEFSDKYEFKKIVKLLREEFANYEVKSVLYGKLNRMAVVSYTNKPCKTTASYSLIWELSLQKK